MHLPENFYFHFFQPEYRIVIAFLLSAIFNFYSIPVIIHVSKAKKLYDAPDKRKKHNVITPTMGGLGIYAAITVVSLTFINGCGMNGGGITDSLTSLAPIIAGFTIIFLVGMKDDMLNIAPTKKLIAEIVALLILIIIGNIRINSMQGMFHIEGLGYGISILLSLFAGVVIINAFNLIDGIDGLAAAIVMLASLVFGSYFLITYEWEYAVLSFIIIGALIPFFLYNAFGNTNKIFMGDTGSLILGYLMTVLVFRFNKMNSEPTQLPHFAGGPAFSFAVLIIPLFDTLRVFIVRLIRNKNPFQADRRHIHHLLIDMGYTHLQATVVLISINIVFILFAYYFNFLGNSVLLLIMLGAAFCLSAFAMWLHRWKNTLGITNENS